MLLEYDGMPADNGHAFLCMLCRNGIVCCAAAGYHAYDAGMWRRPGVAGRFFRDYMVACTANVTASLSCSSQRTKEMFVVSVALGTAGIIIHNIPGRGRKDPASWLAYISPFCRSMRFAPRSRPRRIRSAASGKAGASPSGRNIRRSGPRATSSPAARG